MKFNTTPNGYLFAALLALLQMAAYAQKLPNVQKDALLAPANIKIDGKANEWPAEFKAFNKATLINYTMANNQENLYLVVQSDNRDVIGKILSGGITLIIKSRNKDQKLKPVSLTFPIIERMEKSEILNMMKNKEVNQDSMLKAVNARINLNSKEIKISGFQQLTDSTLSVYNEEGIKAASAADSKRSWTYELQLPVKYFSHLLDTNNAFDYKIILNGVQVPPNMTMVTGRSMAMISISSVNGPAFDAFSPTDFSATYTLAK